METFGPRSPRIYEELPAKLKAERAADEIIIYASPIHQTTPRRVNNNSSSNKKQKNKYETLKEANNARNEDGSSDTVDAAATPTVADELADSLQSTRVKNADDETTSHPSRLDDDEMTQIELFYGSHKTDVFVCGCECLVYACPVTQPVASDDAPPLHAAVPVLLLDTGGALCRQERRLFLVLAERGTGFMVWRDRIDNLSNYQPFGPDYHTMFFSTDHKKLVGLRFSDADVADAFHAAVRRRTGDVSDPALSVNGCTRRKQPARRRKSAPLPTKADISQPIGFQHLTSLDAAELHRYATLRDKVPSTSGDDSSTDDSAIVADCGSSIGDCATYVAENGRYSVVVASV
ncbi:PREDICTED: uncharacterized protein LOC106813303 [Priapulus caudatus]|uniref:Uncharacterized protein LOC106813303 n=1 Tax=Priapulus caudatus TaxID=37621 RepID=A0ABM1EL22_PRICU|nr:PREDICTED: uncharacterized protein LOC106813303 [Priapulus caudatus]